MAQKMKALSRELIIHPGETLKEIMDDREITQKDLASRSCVTEKHVSTVINGIKPISVAYAKKLEYVLGIPASFWINLQANYDLEIMDFEEINSISSEELAVAKTLHPVSLYLQKQRIINEQAYASMEVLELRKFLSTCNLVTIPQLTQQVAYRVRASSNNNVYVLYAWQRLCEAMTKDIETADVLDVKRLVASIPLIKQKMFMDPNTIRQELKSLFAQCGIAFEIVKHFRGAPVQGFIRRLDQRQLILCLTIRQSFADIFWFTLFHEIAHVLHGDIKQRFVDYSDGENEAEQQADRFAADTLLSPDAYMSFVAEKDFSLSAIQRFAAKQNVQPFIVIGRLKKDGIVGYSQFSSQMIRYRWVESE